MRRWVFSNAGKFVMAITRVGAYTIVAELGKGAHSTILHIRRKEDGRAYALKLVPLESPEDRKFLDQAEHEFRVSQMLEHPNLIKIYCLEAQKDWLFRIRKVLLLIEFVNGKTLNNVKTVLLPQLLPILVQVASGMVHMHRRGVFHADLKPNNIMVTRNGQAKVIDYGLAWIRGESKGRVQGTPEYMAPETTSLGVVNEKTDIFNFGATMYRMVTWRLPPSLLPAPGTPRLNAKSYAQLLKPVAELNPQAPKELCDLIHQCLSFTPENRPERMSEIQGALDRIAEALGPPEQEEIPL
jgi:eukaryotic-like serine/threonine-protein kinase